MRPRITFLAKKTDDVAEGKHKCMKRLWEVNFISEQLGKTGACLLPSHTDIMVKVLSA